mmetsp:Transcript_71520/g.155377  ORF Transcript_71520/g.155377 Transcript_71520/m.155377 type:complete len:232 (+) Transcript_71520:549-1244(+)
MVSQARQDAALQNVAPLVNGAAAQEGNRFASILPAGFRDIAGVLPQAVKLRIRLSTSRPHIVIARLCKATLACGSVKSREHILPERTAEVLHHVVENAIMEAAEGYRRGVHVDDHMCRKEVRDIIGVHDRSSAQAFRQPVGLHAAQQILQIHNAAFWRASLPQAVANETRSRLEQAVEKMTQIVAFTVAMAGPCKEVQKVLVAEGSGAHWFKVNDDRGICICISPLQNGQA